MREIAEAASLKLDLPPGALERYLTENIQFDLDEENLAGLRLYFEKAAAMGLIPRDTAAGVCGSVPATTASPAKRRNAGIHRFGFCGFDGKH